MVLHESINSVHKIAIMIASQLKNDPYRIQASFEKYTLTVEYLSLLKVTIITKYETNVFKVYVINVLKFQHLCISLVYSLVQWGKYRNTYLIFWL